MYPFPTLELNNLVTKTSKQYDLPQIIQHEILSLTSTLLAQNYSCCMDITYIQNEGLAMGAPTSSLFSEFFLPNLEISKIADILIKHHNAGYIRYVDDILIAYRHDLTDTQDVLSCFNNLTPQSNIHHGE
jgi:hypothetical protein